MPLEPTHQAPRKTTLLGRKFSTLSLVSPVAKQASNIALASVSSQLTEKLPASMPDTNVAAGTVTRAVSLEVCLATGETIYRVENFLTE